MRASDRSFCFYVFVLFILLIFSFYPTHAQIYWCEGGWGPGNVYRANSDGSGGNELIASDTSADLFITIDSLSRKVIWSGYGKIQKSNIDGTNVESIITGNYYYSDMDIDYTENKLYWTAFENPMPSYDNVIQRSNLDGTDVETILTLDTKAEGFAIDSTAGKMYWTMRQDETQHEGFDVCRSNLDGTDIEYLVEGLEILDVELDISDGKMYWTDWVAGTVSRSNLDGSDIELLYSGSRCPYGIDLDARGKMYWAEWDGYAYNTGQILRANVDGSDVETLYVTSNRPSGITVIPEPTSLCFLVFGSLVLRKRIRRSKQQAAKEY